MELEIKKENLLIRLKNLLHVDDVKLWLPPYYEEEKLNIDSIQELVEKYYRKLNIDQETCFELLEDLQRTSLCRLEERNNFRTQGLATLRIRVSSKQVPEFSVPIKLCDIANDLRALIAEKVNVPVTRLKLICGGRVLIPEQVLGNQNVKHGCTILVVVLSSEEEKLNLVETNNNQTLLNEMKSDVECLLTENSDKYLNVTNQSGASLNLPADEKKALAVAMALHDKGKATFRTGNFSLALVFFLEADTEFKYCRSDMLKQVDNYALLNLDIVWTYLHLQSLHCLNDAEERLKMCEQGFIRTYGTNMERLERIKGGSGNESVLLVRLRLLQGILYYLTNHQEEAVRKFNEVETTIQMLKVDTENVKTLCNLGYPASEAKTALRATFNDLNAAVDYIDRQREEKKRIREHERIRKFADRHKCLNGTLVNLTVLEQLRNMGFSRLFGVYALMNSNNRINDALVWIDNFFNNLYAQYPSSVVNMLKTLDIDDRDARGVLKWHFYELNDACVRELLLLVDEEELIPAGPDDPVEADRAGTSDGFEADRAGTSDGLSIEQSDGLSIEQSDGSSTEQSSSQQPSTSSGSGTTATSNAKKPERKTVNDKKTQKKMKRKHEAFSRLQECISENTDDYYHDMDLQSVEEFLCRYKSLLPQ